MPLTLGKVQKLFKVFGKLIFAAQQTQADSLTYQRLLVLTHRQTLTGETEDYDDMREFATPFKAKVDEVLKVLDSLPAKLDIVLQGYLSKGVAADVGLAVGSAAQQVAAALVTQMTALGATVAVAGADPYTSFAKYFNAKLGVNLPTSETPNVLDAWIDDDLIA